MIIRVRTQLGVWKVKDVSPSDTILQLKQRVEKEHHVDLSGRPFTRLPNGDKVLHEGVTLGSAGLSNGDMIYISVDETQVGVHENSTSGKVITKDGNIVAKEYSATTESAGFRPGMMPLRSMKMHWTLNEFMSLDEQFVYRIKRQEETVCKKVSVDTAALHNFQQYMWSYNFQKIRVGIIYGYFLDNGEVKGEVIYEPPQESTDVSFNLLQDPYAHQVEALANLLGMVRVGWVVAHPPREKGFFLSGAEVITAAEFQLEAAGGIADTPFVTVMVTVNEDANVTVEGYQVSKQCMDMVAEGALLPSRHLGEVLVHKSFTAICEGKEVNEINTNFFLTVVPIGQHESTDFISTFPRLHRVGMEPGADDIKRQLEKTGREGWRMIDLLADFHLLLFLSNFLDIGTDIPAICRSITDKTIPLDEGYTMLIKSFAGMDI